MDDEEWQRWKEQTLRRYPPDEILTDDGINLEFKLGGYGFSFKFRYIDIPNISRGMLNPRYCFLHIGKWIDMKSNEEIELKLQIALRDSRKNLTFADLHSNKGKVIEKAEKRERKIRFARK